MPQLTADEHKAAELFIDFQWRVISQLIDALGRGFGLYFLVLGASLTFLSGLGNSPSPTQKIGILIFLSLLTCTGLAALITASKGLRMGFSHLDHAFRSYNRNAYDDLYIRQYFANARAYLTRATIACGSGLSIILVFCLWLIIH
jgi:hypothetical protein